ncbi:hypothetical protein OH77DRAFT_539561 [Trametes cingulata]|nr:hypothetical protein OH77DRAFT_539561 [Trametes cingulata]
MENVLSAHSEPIVYQAPAGHKSSPYKANHLDNFDPGKAGLPLAPDAVLDRRLVGDSSMGTTVLVDFDTFVREVLPSFPSGSKYSPLPEDKVSLVRNTLWKKFRIDIDPKKKSSKPKEDEVAEVLVRLTSWSSLGNSTGHPRVFPTHPNPTRELTQPVGPVPPKVRTHGYG